MADPIADPIKVFLLDDHEIVRRGVADLIDAEEDMVVIGQWGGRSAPWNGSRRARPTSW